MDRDVVLAAALGAAVAAGCTTSERPAPEPTAAVTPTPTAVPEDPDVVALRSWLAAERRLAARYAAVVRQVPALRPLRVNHTTRATALTDHLRARGVDPGPAATVAPLRGKPGTVVRTLARAERDLAAAYVATLPKVGDTAVLLLGAEFAAGARQHAVVLAQVEVPR
ncbi:MAG TPA: hypothetical protein VNA20_13045 [Frankiaceae bacterium]|nr:hypothetical protein [Frankiaceae bacterium]